MGRKRADDELVQRGLEAIAEYDYELARTLLTRAFDQSGGGEAAARALLTLLVDHLAASQDAIELSPRLSRDALHSPDVNRALSLAAARFGDRELARAHMARLEGAAKTEILIVLAEAAIASGDVDEARRLCEEARTYTPTDPKVRDIAHRLARLREGERRPLEAEIEMFVAKGALDEGRRLAEQVLARFPESAVARRVVHAALEHQRAQDAETRVRAAEDALARPDLTSIRPLCEVARIALAAAAPDKKLSQRLAAVELEVVEREVDAQVRDVLCRLADTDLRVGLTRYLLLSPVARRKVRENSGRPVLDNLEQLLGRRADPAEAVEALLAFGEAAELAEHDPENALYKLTTHERVLVGLGAASRLADQLRQRIRERRKERLADLLAAVRGALDGHSADGAIALLGTVNSRDLEPGDREVFDALRASAQALLETRAMEASYEALLRAGDSLAAREVAERLLERVGEAERPAWQARIAAAREAARRAYGVWVSQADDGPAQAIEGPSTIALGAPLSLSECNKDPLPWLDPEARSLVLTECCDHWLFVYKVDLVAGRVRARAVFRVPERLGGISSTSVSPDGILTIAGERGAVFACSLETWEPLSWRTSASLKSREFLDKIKLAPIGRFAWIHTRRHFHDHQGRVRVFELDRGRVTREISDGWWFQPLVGPEGPMMAHSRHGGALSLHLPDGTLVDNSSFQFTAPVSYVLAHPTSRRLLVLVNKNDKLGFVEVDSTGTSSAPRWLDAVDPGRPWSSVTSLAHRMSCIVAYDDQDRIFLQALSAEQPDGRLENLYRVQLPAFPLLARDSASRHVVALVPEHERLHIVPLGAAPPAFPTCEPEPVYGNALDLDLSCPMAHIDVDILETVREVHGLGERAAAAWMHRQFNAASADVAQLLNVHDTLLLATQSKVAEELRRKMTEMDASDPHVVLLEAEAHHRDWPSVRRALEGIDLRTIIAERRQHAYHLLALALFYEGEIERAIAVVEEGQRDSQGRCRLSELLEMMRPVPAGSRSRIHELRAALEEADGCLLRGDLFGARAAIDRRNVWCSGEVHSLACLAEVELRTEPDTDAGRFRKALALARFLAVQRRSPTSRRELPMPGTSWTAERLQDIEARAAAWFEQLGAPVAPPPVIAQPLDDVPPAAVENLLPVARPPWSLTLCELDEALESMSADESQRTPARLAFRVRHSGRRFEGIEVLLQRPLRGGRFSAGQVADAGELLAAAGMLTEDADAAAVVVLTEGIPQAPRTRPPPSRARMLRLLAALEGHPRVFLADRPAESVIVQRAQLELEFVAGVGGLVPRFILGGARWTADELLAHAETSTAIDVDPEGHAISLAPFGAAVLALAQAFQRHQPIFPEESRHELRRRLGALRHAIELHVPDELAGKPVTADSRPVVRLTPEGDAGLFVEIGVRPVPEAVFGPPGEGSRLALGAVDGLHVSARRDLARERASAERLTALPGFAGAIREGRWRYRTNGEEQSLAVIEALAELGREVVVEWPKDARAWRWVGRATPGDLRVHIARDNNLLRIDGSVEIDGHRVALATLLEAIAQGRRYVLIGPQTFLSLAAELRERLEAAGVLVHAGRGGLEAGLSAAPVLADLEAEERATDTAWRSLRERMAAARALEPEPPAGLHADLRPYQLEGFRWLARLSAWTAGACLADDMGLGKTLQALALLVHRAPLGPALVIAPISVTPGWTSEAARFAPGLRVLPYRGADRETLLTDTRPGDVVVAGYGVVTRDVEILAGLRFSTLVLDEAHFLKNAATQRARAVGRLQAEFRLALTGTPVENHLTELWSLFQVIAPRLLGTWSQFRERYAAPIERDQSRGRLVALAQVLRPFVLRRTKENVLPELPPRIELDRLVRLSAAEREVYETARLAAAAMITEAQTPDAPGQRFAVLGTLTRLRRLSCHPRLVHEAWIGPSSKLDAFMAVVDEFRATGHRALVFSQFTAHLALVREALIARGIATVYLDGDMSVDERGRAVEAFQRGEGDLFLISLKAGGTGLNLTAADHVIHLDPWWNPAVEDQATDRAHRLGQTRPVTVIRLIAQGTIEEAVLALHAEKRDLAERLLEGTDLAGRLSAAELVELVRRGTLNPVEMTEDEPEDVPEPPRGLS